MGLFDTLKEAIFRHSAGSGAKPSTAPASAPSAPAATPRPSPAQSTSPTQTPAVSGSAGNQVDVEATLNQLNARQAQSLNWRTSIVDLMKLVGMDSSLQNRQQLAKELGYSGSTSDSAAMNVWLHQEVMRKLAQGGFKVPSVAHS